MAVRPIILYPDIGLKTICAPVCDFARARQVAADLRETMDAAPPRTVGIAAPQIGELTRVVLAHSERNPRYPGGHGFLALVNPVIVAQDGEQSFREGCLSLPQYTANVRRASRIVVHAFSLDEEPLEIEAGGFESVVLQHEIDHLDGLLFLDRVLDVKTDLFRRRS